MLFSGQRLRPVPFPVAGICMLPLNRTEELVQQTCTCRRKRRFCPGKRWFRPVLTLKRAKNALYWIPGTGFRSSPGHKHGRRQSVNEGASFAGGSHMPLYVWPAAPSASGPILRGRLPHHGKWGGGRRRSRCAGGRRREWYHVLLMSFPFDDACRLRVMSCGLIGKGVSGFEIRAGDAIVSFKIFPLHFLKRTSEDLPAFRRLSVFFSASDLVPS